MNDTEQKQLISGAETEELSARQVTSVEGGDGVINLRSTGKIDEIHVDV